MMDGMTNINLAATGDGEIPEAGEEGEDGEGEGEGDLERAEGEEGEEGAKLPKISAEQALELRKAFDEMDENGDGVVGKEELAKLLQVLGEELVTDEFVEEVMKAADEDEDGKLQFDEFVKAITAAEEEGEKPEGEEDGEKKPEGEEAEEKKAEDGADPNPEDDNNEEKGETQQNANEQEVKEQPEDKKDENEGEDNEIEQPVKFLEDGVKFAGRPNEEESKDQEMIA
jgi:segregation and condensation protein B